MTKPVPFTKPPWIFERHTSALQLAALGGETLAAHEGYFRTNDGAWIVTHAGDGDEIEGGQICLVTFHGQAKRGQAYCAPDPEGQANARLIARAPAFYTLLAESVALMEIVRRDLEAAGVANLGAGALGRQCDMIRAELAKAVGEAADL